MGFEVIQGDCLEVMRGMADSSVDAVITDPPYCSGGYLEAQKNTKAQGLRGATVNAEGFEWFAGDNMSTSGLLWLLRAAMHEFRRVLKPNRSIFVFTDWRMVVPLSPALEACGVRHRNNIIWDKGSAGLGSGFKSAYEVIMEFSHGTTEYQRRDGQNVLRYPRVPSSRREHKAEKPVGLLAELIRTAVPEGGAVLDAFAGAGSTGVACVQEGRGFVGIEREPHYVERARRRIDEAVNARPLFAEAVA